MKILVILVVLVAIILLAAFLGGAVLGRTASPETAETISLLSPFGCLCSTGGILACLCVAGYCLKELLASKDSST